MKPRMTRPPWVEEVGPVHIDDERTQSVGEGSRGDEPAGDLMSVVRHDLIAGYLVLGFGTLSVILSADIQNVVPQGKHLGIG